MKNLLLLSCTVAGASALALTAGIANAFPQGLSPAAQPASVMIVAAGSKGDEIAMGAEHFVSALAEEGIGFLGNGKLSLEDRKASFKKLLSNKFDMQTIGRFALGRHWQTATSAQREEYLDLFQKMTINSYAKRFDDYQGQALTVRGSRAEGSASDILVHSVITQKSGPEVKVDWRVRYKNGGYKVIDVIVEGVSMAVTQRADFSSVIQRGGGKIEVLLAHLRGA
ncbi:MAG: ABC transporter substrate-binding protein [Alphaproteobacteria bacterium]|nr:ABC transporter substrate-binding protein [Alphaproteobacteria bacterium]